MDQISPLNETATTFLSCISRAEHRTWPYDHWLLADALPERIGHAIAGLPVAPPSGATFDGRRESNNSTRIYFSPENQARFPVCRAVADAFHHPRIIAALERATGRDLSAGQLRIEYCQDVDGFWLEPHVDISVKLFTMLIYLSRDEALANAGTDVMLGPPDHKVVGTAPYAFNTGMIFIPDRDTWHGFVKRPIRGIRKSIIVNYVTDAWRATDELA